MKMYNSELAIEFYYAALERLHEEIPVNSEDGYEVLEELYDGETLSEVVFRFDYFGEEDELCHVKIHVGIDDDDELVVMVGDSDG